MENSNQDPLKILKEMIGKLIDIESGKLGTVRSVDKEKYLCSVDPDDGGPQITDAKLTKGHVPKVGSKVALVGTHLKSKEEGDYSVAAVFDFEEKHIKAKKIIMEIDGDGTVALGSKDADEPAVLGNKLVDKLDEVMQLLMTHTHPSPGSPPSGMASVDFTSVKSDKTMLE